MIYAQILVDAPGFSEAGLWLPSQARESEIKLKDKKTYRTNNLCRKPLLRISVLDGLHQVFLRQLMGINLEVHSSHVCADLRSLHQLAATPLVAAQ